MSADQVFIIGQGNTSPDISMLLFPKTIVLTGATVTFSLVSASGKVMISNAPAVIVAATVNPEVKYSWVDGDTDRIGEYTAYFDVDYGASGKTETMPNESHSLTVRIPARF